MFGLIFIFWAACSFFCPWLGFSTDSAVKSSDFHGEEMEDIYIMLEVITH